MSDASKKAALKWFKENEPFAYNVALKRLEMKNSVGLGSVEQAAKKFSISDLFKTVTDTVANIAPQFLAMKQQKKIMDMQLDRAKKGLPPASVDDYTPAFKVSAQITPETEKAITRTAIATTKTAAEKLVLPLAIGGATIVAVLLLKRGK